MTISYKIKITGITALLLHRDNIDWADHMRLWREDPDNRKASIAGDDRSPAFTWLGSLYDEADLVVMPTDNIMRCLMEGGAMVPVPGGKNGKTFKAQTQSGMSSPDLGWPLMVDNHTISHAALMKLQKEKDFSKHQAAAIQNGFSLFVKRAKIGASKHIRVRPKFARWELTGQIDVWDEQITTAALTQIVYNAGYYKGLGDWRPSSPKAPGAYGRFTAEIEPL